MSTYLLAKVVQLAGGTIASRKRIQKTVHLLQAAGLDFGMSFQLHYYGPYSAELAEKLDWMTSKKVLLETVEEVQAGRQYEYSFNPSFQESLEEFEKSSEGEDLRHRIELKKSMIDELVQTPARVLELASTIVAFFQQEVDWNEAIRLTAEFKREQSTSRNFQSALALAKRVVDGKNP